MVKAYLKYVQQDVYGGLVGNQANIVVCKIYDQNDEVVGVFLVSACNEVANFTNLKTGEVRYKVYDKEALHGHVTCLQATSDFIAIGYSSGKILVYSLKVEGE